MRKSKYVVIIGLSLSIIFYGILKVSSTLPTFVKNKSNFKVYFTERPFDLTFETKNYIIFLNEKAINNIQNSIGDVFNHIMQWSQDKLEESVDAVESKGAEVIRRFKRY